MLLLFYFLGFSFNFYMLSGNSGRNNLNNEEVEKTSSITTLKTKNCKDISSLTILFLRCDKILTRKHIK